MLVCVIVRAWIPTHKAAKSVRERRERREREKWYGVATVSRIEKKYRSLLQKRPIKETILCKRDL